MFSRAYLTLSVAFGAGEAASFSKGGLFRSGSQLASGAHFAPNKEQNETGGVI
jgi:hypothetical protein